MFKKIFLGLSETDNFYYSSHVSKHSAVKNKELKAKTWV